MLHMARGAPVRHTDFPRRYRSRFVAGWDLATYISPVSLGSCMDGIVYDELIMPERVQLLFFGFFAWDIPSSYAIVARDKVLVQS